MNEHINAYLTEVTRHVGRSLTETELAFVLMQLAGYASLLHAGMAPSAVAALAKRESATITH